MGPSPGKRILAIDWLRGLAVLVMIECHSLVFQSSTAGAERARRFLDGVNGLAAPTFILVAGFVLRMVMAHAGADAQAAARRRRRSLHRIGYVLLVALLFRYLQMPMRRIESWLKVDILTCIALGLLGVWSACALGARRPRLAAGALLALAAAVFVLTPLAETARGWGWVIYFLNNTPGFPDSDQGASMFPLLPWAGYALLGGGLGAAAGSARRPPLGTLAAFAAVAIIGAAVAHAGPALDRLYAPRSAYTLANAGERLFRIGAATIVLLGLAALWQRPRQGWLAAPARGATWAIEFLGRRSLAAFVLHLVLIYGALGLQPAHRWHGRLGWWGWAAALAAVTVVTGALCYLLDVAQAQWKALNAPRPKPAPEPELVETR